MIAGTLITIREGLEGFLIVGILVGYLTKVHRPQFKTVISKIAKCLWSQ